MVQSLAEGAELDGLQHPEVHSLVVLGAHGKHKQNVRRDLVRQHFKNIYSPQAMSLTCPLLTKDQTRRDQEQLMLSPLCVMQSIYDCCPALMPQIFGDIESFWRNVRADDPKWHAHPNLREVERYQQRAVPIVLHGDGATFTTRGEHSMFSVSWRGLLSPRFKGWVFPIWSQVKAASTPEADIICWRRLSHLLNSAYSGYHPAVDEHGREWAEGTRQRKWAGQALCGSSFSQFSGLGQEISSTWAMC